jgi:transposase
MTQYTVGLDISKEHLDACRLPDGAVMQFSNDKAGLRDLIQWIGALPVERIAYEPTGAYHRALEDALSAAALPLVKANPLQARRFAQACGMRAKTDRVDAQMLARMGMALQPECTTAPSKMQRDLKALAVARQALIKDRTAAKNRAKQISLGLLQSQNDQRLRQIDHDLEAVDTLMMQIIKSDQSAARNFAILTSIPGMGAITAAALLVEMPELGTLAAKQATSLAGLAPHPRESGKWKGKRFIGAGRKILREALYMPALVACRFNQDMRETYQRLTKAGKPPKLAITAVMRKLIILANALIKNNRIWSPKLA